MLDKQKIEEKFKMELSKFIQDFWSSMKDHFPWSALWKLHGC